MLTGRPILVMPRYTRLRGDRTDGESDGDYFELPEAKTQGSPAMGRGSETPEGAVDYESKPRTIKENGLLSIGKLSNYMKSGKYRAQNVPSQNLENGNPNLSPSNDFSRGSLGTPNAATVPLSGASLREKATGGSGVKLGLSSVSGRWSSGRSSSYEEKGGSRLKSGGEDHSSLPLPSPDDGTLPAASIAQWPDSIRHDQQAHPLPALPSPTPGPAKPQDAKADSQLSCNVHSLCNDVRPSQRFSRNSSVREIGSTPMICVSPMIGMEVTADTKPLVGQSTISDSSVSDAEYWEGKGEKSNRMRRSSSTREDTRSRPDMAIENWRDHPAARSARCGPSLSASRPRVSFPLLENHELDQHEREKWKEPVLPHGKALSNKSSDPLRYNYEQPGFVEREKDGIGRPYTIYCVEGRNDAPRAIIGQPSLSRALSSREKTSTYCKLPRAYSVNSSSQFGQSECVTCGKGLGVVVNEFAGNEVSFCKACKPSAVNGGKSKKKSMLDYCRRLLGLSKKTRH